LNRCTRFCRPLP